MISILTVKPVYQNLPWVYDVLLLVRFTLGYTLCSLKEKPEIIEIPTWRVPEIKDTLDQGNLLKGIDKTVKR